MAMGLILAPILPALVGIALVGLPRGDFRNFDTWFIWGTAALLSLPWSFFAGGYYLWRKRRKGFTIERFQCLAAGATLGFSLPFLHIALWLTYEWIIRGSLGPFSSIMVLIAPFGGLLLIPFGLLGGWVFWRVAVRPVPITVQQLAEAF
jgi:hypothetical protein